MPGILPMKVIKVGTNAQSRIAQACDRCRSKKIRCDGIRPCCSQCANVGFECRTSDKLSRRAFPRGYTESLEERVRVLESEVRELKDLLDEKDEKIDMLSRIHSQSPKPLQLPSPRRSSTTTQPGNGKTDTPPKDEIFKMQQSPYLLQDAGSESYFAGTSSSRTFIEAFKHRVQESGRSTADTDTALLLSSGVPKSPEARASTTPVTCKAPPRLLSDQLINIFFQEWAPLFPVLHRPTFLTLYEKYIADSDAVTDKAEIASLNLVFGIAALSSGTRASLDLDSFEVQWRDALDAIIADNTLATLQALILAQIFCIQHGDYARLLTYKGLSTTLSARLGLHQSQKRFALGTLTCETRKKVFWTLYTVDSFSSVILGLPRHIKDDDVHCEYPVDADDEYVTERGFQPTLPGESTKLSSALALFRASRILSKVLKEIFPAEASYELSLQKLREIADELDGWHNSLAPHLRLQFLQDKPSTGTISSRSPLLSFAYHYIHALIYRPAVCASLGAQSSTSMMAVASSSKRMVQIYQLLKERGLSFSFCLNLDDTLVVAGFGLLFQGLSLEPNSKILKDNTYTLSAIVGTLRKTGAPCASEFAGVATSFVPLQQNRKTESPSLSRHDSDGASINSQSSTSSTKKQLKAIASRFTAGNSAKTATDNGRRATIPNITLHPHSLGAQTQPSLQPSSCSPAPVSRSEPARSPINMPGRPMSSGARPSAPPPTPKHKSRPDTRKLPNLDYLSFGNEPEAQPARQQSQPVKSQPEPTDWEKLLGSLDNGSANIYDACFGGNPVDALLDAPAMGLPSTTSSIAALSSSSIAWNPDLWTNLCQTETNTSVDSGITSSGQAGSILSFSTDEGLSSGEDFSADWTSATSSNGNNEAYRGILIPEPGHEDEFHVSNVWQNGSPL